MVSFANTVTALLATTPGATQATGPTLDPNDQRLLATLKDSSIMPLAGIASASGLSAKAAVESINRLQAANRVEIVEYDDKQGRYLRLTPEGYGALAGMPFPK